MHSVRHVEREWSVHGRLRGNVRGVYGALERIELSHSSQVHVTYGAPTEIRTPVLGLKGPRPSPLDDGGNAQIFKRGDSTINNCWRTDHFPSEYSARRTS